MQADQIPIVIGLGKIAYFHGHGLNDLIDETLACCLLAILVA